ncbi:MAG: DUF962 domain-containing protein [Archangiaceae bacterium]|nr:DUF962 domain-containing protein [Archangiaceae bacterium]
MKDVTAYLTEYAGYHRDKRNIATHFVGIPLIVIAVAGLFAAAHPYAGYAVVLAATVFYFALDLRLGLVMALFNFGALEIGLQLGLWLSVASFVLGWVIQFVGHWFEGKKPAFVDDLVGLLIGPLFIVTEAGFMLGLRKPLQAAIEAKAGPTRINPRRAATASAP